MSTQKKHATEYYGLPFDFRLIGQNGEVVYITNTTVDLHTLSKLDLSGFKMQQFTGVLDMHGTKIYFGDWLRFADKAECYKKDYRVAVILGWKTIEQAMEEVEKMAYEERFVGSEQDFEWLLSVDIQDWWEVFAD